MSAIVIALHRPPRPALLLLMQAVAGMSYTALNVLAYTSDSYAGNYPRFPVPPSLDTVGMNSNAAKLVRIAELISDEGLEKMLEAASRLANSYPVHDAEILKLIKRE